jgi:ribosomal protein S18 acetylase RimI-like enzyme
MTSLRPALPEDEGVLLALMNHLADFPVPLWRTSEEITRADRPMLLSALREPSPETVIIVAEDSLGTVCGYVFVSTHYDFFTGQPHAHIEVVAVDPSFRGQGIGRMLMAEAERWARSRGYDRVTLNVFAANVRAKGLYERLGFEAETVHYLKELKPI